MEEMKHESIEEHVRNHVTYPATKAQILQSCNAEGFSGEDSRKATTNLQDKTYATADEVLKDLRKM